MPTVMWLNAQLLRAVGAGVTRQRIGLLSELCKPFPPYAATFSPGGCRIGRKWYFCTLRMGPLGGPSQRPDVRKIRSRGDSRLCVHNSSTCPHAILRDRLIPTDSLCQFHRMKAMAAGGANKVRITARKASPKEVKLTTASAISDPCAVCHSGCMIPGCAERRVYQSNQRYKFALVRTHRLVFNTRLDK